MMELVAEKGRETSRLQWRVLAHQEMSGSRSASRSGDEAGAFGAWVRWGKHVEEASRGFRREQLLDEALPVKKVAETRFPDKLQGDRACQEQEDDPRPVTVHLKKLDRPRGADDHDLVAAEGAFLGFAGMREGDIRMKGGTAQCFPLHDRRADSLLHRLFRGLRQLERGSMDCVANQDSGIRVGNVEEYVVLIHVRKETDQGTDFLHGFELRLIACSPLQEPLLDIHRAEGPAAADSESPQLIR